MHVLEMRNKCAFPKVLCFRCKKRSRLGTLSVLLPMQLSTTALLYVVTMGSLTYSVTKVDHWDAEITKMCSAM